MKHIKLYEEFVNESKDVDLAMSRIDSLPRGSTFEDAKRIDGVFKKSKHAWSEVIETFEKHESDAVESTIPVKDIRITQPNIQVNKVEKMLNAKDLPLINVVKFKDDYAIYDGHHRLMAAWALGEAKIKVNLVTV